MARGATYNYLEDYLSKVQSKGRVAVTLEELKSNFQSSEKAILQTIFRLKKKNQLAQVRKGFYVIIPPQYSIRGMLPPILFIDDLMKSLNRDYYIGLLSASAIHGAGHQQPMQFQVMTKKPPLRSIKNKKLNIHFYVKSKWGDEEVIKKKTNTGFVQVSSPSLTAFDLIQYHSKIGGLNRIMPILDELTETIKPADLSKTAIQQKNPDLQRLGFLLEQLGNEKLSSVLYKKIEGEALRAIPISLSHNDREGNLNRKWNILMNSELDF